MATSAILHILCDDPHLAEQVSLADSPELFEAWRMWQAADERSSAERAAWDRVMQRAQDYMDSAYGDRVVMDVSPGEED